MLHIIILKQAFPIKLLWICNVKCALQLTYFFFLILSYELRFINKTNHCFQTGFVLVFHCLDKHSLLVENSYFTLFRNSTNQCFTSPHVNCNGRK